MTLAIISSALGVISGDALIHGFIYLLVIGVILGLLFWLVSKSPVPDPLKTVLTWIIYAIAVLILINFLLGFAGYPLFQLR